MRVVAALSCVLALASLAAQAHAQPAGTTVEACLAFEIRDGVTTCCHVFTLCVENVALPPIDAIALVLGDSTECAGPGAPDGWEADDPDPDTVEWVADPGDEIPIGVTVCGFRFSSLARTCQIGVTLLSSGTPAYFQEFGFTCGSDCPVPVEPGTSGRIKSIYDERG